ncbi:amidase [Paraburkholderia sp. DGU8]|uniref:amidase n=1 Tax=Paraburkholderia sp. DGU8 TaxID=3161997 RepID=UPI003466804D
MKELHSMSTLELWRCDASDLRSRFASGAATPEMALESVLSRVEEVNADINAVVTLDIDGARLAAKSATRRWQRGAPVSDLDGIPITIKDNIYVGGVRATWGSLLYPSFIPSSDDLPVAALKRAGCVFLGKTNTPELSMAGYTYNRVFGSTANPWNLAMTPGGSSGGSAAAVAAGICPISLGTDAGGSIRKPAGQTGVVGLKPGIGSVPRRYGFLPLAHDVQVIGPFARSVADLTSVYAAIADRPFQSELPRRLRIGAFVRFPGNAIAENVDATVSSAFDEGVAVLRSMGHEVLLIDPLWNPEVARDIFNALVNVGIARVVKDIPTWREDVTPAVLAMAEAGRDVSADRYVEVIDKLTLFRWRLRDAIADFDVIVTPVMATAGWLRDQPSPPAIAGEPAKSGAPGAFTAAVSLAGLPAMSLPAPVPSGSTPIGLQFVTALGGEALLLSLAAAFEQAAPWQKLAPFTNGATSACP